MTLAKQSPESRRRLALALAVFLLYMFYMTAEVNIYLYRSLRGTYYAWAVPVVVAGTLYFRRGKGGSEYRLLVCYWLWFLVSRALNHNLALVDDDYLCFDLSLMIPFLALGLSLDARGRRRFLDWFSAAVGGYYFLIGAVALYCFVARVQLVNPLTEWTFGMAKAAGFERVNIMGTNADSTAYWFMSALMLMLYQFFACRKKLWRIPIVLSALVDFAVIAVTYTRSVRVAVAAVLALLAVLLLWRKLRGRKRALRAALLVLVFLAAAPLVYKGFELCADSLSALSETLRAPAAAQSEAAPLAYFAASGETAAAPLAAAQAGEAGGLYERLNELSSKRLEIYRCAFLTIREHPSILLRGCLSKDSMGVTNAILQRKNIVPHFHNFLLQTLILTGLPGLALVLAFCVLTAVKALRLLFARDERVGMDARALSLIVFAPPVYCLFEACLFTDIDVRPLFFFVVCGMLLGTYCDLYPKGKE